MPIIEVDHLTKEYRLGAMQGLKQTLMLLFLTPFLRIDLA